MLETWIARERNGIRFENEPGSRESNGIGKELEISCPDFCVHASRTQRMGSYRV